MAGHSKWANIQHRKKAQDAKRGKVFTKLIREITVAARTGDPDPGANPRLRLAVDKALSANMSKDTIERAIKRGSGAQDGENFDEIRYEGYGPGGVAVMVDCLTDNRNRHRFRSAPRLYQGRRQPWHQRFGRLPVFRNGHPQLSRRQQRGCDHGSRARGGCDGRVEQ